MQKTLLILGAFFIALAAPSVGAKDAKLIEWQDWSPAIFAQAKAQNRFVILDLEAVWCHWCHVMDAETYANPAVAELIEARYIPVRVDQDSHPALSNRYGDWGWPATIVFAPDGSEIVKRQGYLPAPLMVSMLQAIIDDPSPGPSVITRNPIQSAEEAGLTVNQRQSLSADLKQFYDAKNGGWGNLHKYLDAAPLAYQLLQAEHNSDAAAVEVRKTLNAGRLLIDPVWGGVYQYSDSADWRSPHFEKIMSFQADNIRLYSEGYARWNDPLYRANAAAIVVYLNDFLMAPNGAFYTSQDADLNDEIDGHEFYALTNEKRQKLGLPRVDKHIYARENGWAIRALARYADVTGDPQSLNTARAAAQAIIANRGLANGGFAHGEKLTDGPYLGDSLAMSQALLALYRSTGERNWLTRAIATLDFIEVQFRDDKVGGYITAQPDPAATGVLRKPVYLLDENVQLVRAAQLARFYTGETRFQAMAEHALRYAVAPAILDSRPFLANVLLADYWLNHEPAHVTIVGHKDDPAARALFNAARRYPADYMLVEWWDKREGPLPNPAINYPELEQPAAFACADRSCSLPVFEPDKVAAAVSRLSARDQRQALQ